MNNDSNQNILNLLGKDNAIDGIVILEKSIDKIAQPAILCEVELTNPNRLEIIYCNNRFSTTFGGSVDHVIGKNYDFLFEDMDVDYSSDNQVQYTKLLKAVKNFQPISVNIEIPDFADKEIVTTYCINFNPNDFKSDNCLYCIFTFEKVVNLQLPKAEALDKNQQSLPLIKNLERLLRNERLLRSINDLIISDLPVKEVAQNIVKSLCETLQIDRCVVHDYKSGETTFLIEHNSSSVKSMINGAETNNDLSPITRYINFQNQLFKNFNIAKSHNTTLISNDVSEDLRFGKIEDICKEFSIVSQIAIMTALNDFVNGGIYIHQSSKREWTSQEVELIEMIASQFSMAIDRSYSIEKVMIANHELLEKTLELKKSLKEEKHMRQIQNEFVAMVSHEFKTPMQIIDSTREILSRKIKSYLIDDESINKSLDKIKTGVIRINGLIQSNLNLSQIELNGGILKTNPDNFSIKDLLAEIVDRNSNLINDKSIKVLVEIDALPDVYLGDRKLLDHSFTNIVTNAIKYSKNDSTVKITAGNNKDNIFIQVVDGGIGIPKADLANIGKKFFRAKNTLSVAGTGIGLYLAKYFVELHNGSVLIESELGVGTTVTITLPINKENASSNDNK